MPTHQSAVPVDTGTRQVRRPKTEESQWEHPSDEYYRDLLHRLLREDAEVDHSEDDSNSIGGRGMVVAVHDLEERSDGEDILL